MQNSEIAVSSHGSVCYSGPDAVNLVRAITLKTSLDFYGRSKLKMTRHLTPTLMLKLAGEYTGKMYKRGQYQQAAADLGVWIETMRAALPVTHY